MTIKPQFAHIVIGFNHSALPLGERSDLHILYEIAKSAHRQDYLEMFETTEESDEIKIARFDEKRNTKKIKRNNAHS